MIPSVADVPPHDTDMESALLGAIMLGDEVEVGLVLASIAPADFVSGPHRRLYEAIQTVAMQHGSSDAAMVLAECRAAGILDGIGGVEFIRAVVQTVETAANLAKYAERVRDLSARRSVLRASQTLRDAAVGGKGTADDLIEYGESMLFALRRSSASMRPSRALDVAGALVDEWEGRTTTAPALASGFIALDDVIGGFHEGQLVTIAGATAMGKTTFALNLARYATLAQHPTLLFSLEMSEREVVRSMLCAEVGADTRQAHTSRNLPDHHREALAASWRRGWLAPLKILDTPTMTAAQIRAVARRDIASRGTRLVIVDYVQLISPGAVESEGQTREQQVAAISRSMKALARETRVPIVILAQLNRDADKRPQGERRPRLSDLRESAAIAHDSDLVLGMYRASYYEPDNRLLANQIEVGVMKNRFGPTARIPLAYSPASAFIGDLRNP